MRIFHYRLPLTRPLVTPAGTLHEREGYLLELAGKNGKVGYGDMAPLPGFSPEAGKRGLAKALAKACRELRKEPEVIEEDEETWYQTTLEVERQGCLSAVGSLGLPSTWRMLRGPGLWMVSLPEWLYRIVEPPLRALIDSRDDGLAHTAFFAWFSALQDLMCKGGLFGGEQQFLDVNGLLDPRAGDLDGQLEELRENKYRTVKVKTSSEPGEALKQAHAAAEGLGGEVALRFDANRGWTLGQALAFCDGIRDLNVEYLEEPLRDPAGAVELRSRTGVPLAADESLREGECPWADVWVIKPTLGPNWLEHLQQASERGQRAVISACFESGVGIAGLARLATKFPASAQSACGLDTYRWLARDILDLPLKFAEGRLLLSDVAASMDTVNTSGLECVLDE